MQSLCSFINNFDNGARTSVRVSERRQPLVFWESDCGSVTVLSVAIIKFKDKQVVRVNTRRKYGLMNWNDTTGVSSTCRTSFNKNTVPNVHFLISFQI